MFFWIRFSDRQIHETKIERFEHLIIDELFADSIEDFGLIYVGY